MRIFHVLNGGSGVCGLTDIEWVCCQVEDAIEKDPAALDHACLLSVKNWLKSVFDAVKQDQPLPVLEETLLETIIPACLHVQRSPAAGVAVPDSLYEDSIFNEFVDDQQTVPASIEALLLKLEQHPDAETLEELKRVFHTLKSEVRVFGLSDIETLCHAVEDQLETKGTAVRIDTLFGVKDFLARCFRALISRAPLPQLPPAMLAMLTIPDIDTADGRLTAAVVFDPLKGPVEFKIEPPAVGHGQHVDPPEQLSASLNLLNADLDLLSDFVSEVKEHIDNIDTRLLSLENNPGDSDLLNAVFRVFHTIKGAAGFLALDEISRLSHITESLLDGARKGDILLRGVSIDVVFEAVDEMKNLVGTIETAISSGTGTYPSSTTVDRLVDKIKRVLAVRPDQERRLLTPADTQAAAGDVLLTPPPERLSSTPRMPPVTDVGIDASVKIVPAISSDASSSSASQAAVGGEADDFFEIQAEPYDDETEPAVISSESAQPVQYRAKIKESIKVDAENLDKLIDAIGELVIIEAMIRQDGTLRTAASSNLLRTITQMDKITRELQTLGMSLRMIPIKPTFQKMARVVRDLAKKGSKKIEFITQGEETMLDKSVVDRIGDPLIHLVRNAVDHGIESSHDDRRRNGKNPVGRISLNAFHKGGNIYVEIRDDGRGLDRAAIIRKAAEKGMIREGQQLSEREIYNLILLPGFSTAAKVTDVSGRGVGMDVVKRTIEDLRGTIDIHSEHGTGTTITLRLPLTLAIIDGMLVRIGTERYIIPTLSIVKSIRPCPEDVTTVVNKGEMVAVRDTLIPLLRLARLFDIRDAVQNIEDGIVIVVEDSGRMTGLLVDELLGQQSTVIKSLGALKGMAGISGGSIMTDGSVGIILDIAGVVKLAFGDNAIEQV